MFYVFALYKCTFTYLLTYMRLEVLSKCRRCTGGKDLDHCHVTRPKSGSRSRPRSLTSVETAAASRQRQTSNHSAPASSSSSSSSARVVNNWVTRSLGHADDDVINSHGDVTPAPADGQLHQLFTGLRRMRSVYCAFATEGSISVVQ